MKTPITSTIVSLLSLAFLGSLSLKAQNTGAAPATPSCPVAYGKAACGKGSLSLLNDQERAQLQAAMKKIKNDPQMAAARQAVKEAQTKEAKAAAKESLRQTRRDLLLKADPSLAPVLDKLKAAMPGKGRVS